MNEGVAKVNEVAVKKTLMNTFLKHLIARHEVGIFLALLILILIFSLFSERFLTTSNLLTIANQVSMVFIIAVGMTVVIILGGIDLSAGSVAGLAGMITAGALSYGVGNVGGILIGLSVGIVAGMLNGLIITQVGITDFIVTLASMSIAHGFIFAYSGGKTIYQNIPKSFLFIGQGRVVDIPVPVILALIVFVLGHLLLSRFRIGVHVYATGGNREAARLSGIKVDKVRIFSYTVSGLTAATAGIIMASRLGSGQPTAGDTFLFDAIGAVVLGGTSLMGGTGTVVGTLAGVGIIGVISNGLTQLNVSFYYQEVIKGLIILLAVSYNSYRDKQ